MRHKPSALVTALVLVTGFRTVVRLRGFSAGGRLAMRLASARPSGRPIDVEAATAAVDAVARRLPINGRCLARSLALWTVLRRHGVAAELRLGVHTADPSRAHAWVVVDDIALGERLDAATAELPLSGVLPAELVGHR